MIKFIAAIITFCLMIGVGDTLVRMTNSMATGTKKAFLHDQMSYAAFTKALIEAKKEAFEGNSFGPIDC